MADRTISVDEVVARIEEPWQPEDLAGADDGLACAPFLERPETRQNGND